MHVGRQSMLKCIHVYMCIFGYFMLAYISMCFRVFIWSFVVRFTSMYVSIHACIYPTCILCYAILYTQIYVYIWTSGHPCVCLVDACMHLVIIYVCVYVFIHTYICTYLHIHNVAGLLRARNMGMYVWISPKLGRTWTLWCHPRSVSTHCFVFGRIWMFWWMHAEPRRYVTSTYMHACMHACIRTYVHTYVLTHRHTHTNTYTHTYICTHTYTHTHTHTHQGHVSIKRADMKSHIHACGCEVTHTYIHTCTHTHTHQGHVSIKRADMKSLISKNTDIRNRTKHCKVP